ncbi:MAG: nodulation protein NfeD [Arenicellales bacterium]|nr:nodulation protein NfeD [Arenicellales bacterium]
MLRSQQRFSLSAGLLVWLVGIALYVTGTLMAQETDTRRAIVLEVEGVIGPASNDFIVRGIEQAEESGAVLVILRMNTPGGLDTSMRDIIQKILASRVPVVSYVAPPGSRAASAGTYIMYASHIAAMAPATNLGSATPVTMSPGGIGRDPEPPGRRDDEEKAKSEESTEKESDETEAEDKPPELDTAMERKVVNDAVAYIKGLARLRKRDEKWAEDAVRSAVNLTAEDALQRNVIDIVAKDLDGLMEQLDGRTVELQSGEVTLNTKDLKLETIEPDWRTKLLAIITNPNVAYILMLLGVYGLFFELSNPGSIFPGVVGAICLLLALYSFQVLPVNYAGVALILLGIAFMVGELFMPSFGVLGIGGTIAFVVGSLILMETEVEAFQLSMTLIVTVTIITVLFVFTLIAMAVRQRKKPVVSGREQMIGDIGEATSDFAGIGNIHIHGELWSARSDQPVRKGQHVKVRELDGLILVVEPLEG